MKRMRIFESLSQFIAETEIQKYHLLDNNCQTIVSRLIYFIQQNFKYYLLPIDLTQLTLSSQTLGHRSQNHLQTYSSQVSSVFESGIDL